MRINMLIPLSKLPYHHQHLGLSQFSCGFPMKIHLSLIMIYTLLQNRFVQINLEQMTVVEMTVPKNWTEFFFRIFFIFNQLKVQTWISVLLIESWMLSLLFFFSVVDSKTETNEKRRRKKARSAGRPDTKCVESWHKNGEFRNAIAIDTRPR